MTKKEKTFFKNVKALDSKLTKYEEGRPKKYHITAEIKRGITFTKANGKKYKYDAQYQHGKLKTKDSLLDSRVIEAKSEKDAKDIMIAEIEEAFAQDEYSGAAAYSIDDINFIDTVNESSLTQQPTANMPMKHSKHVDYSFTNEDKQFLDTESEGTCVIDNFIGMHQSSCTYVYVRINGSYTYVYDCVRICPYMYVYSSFPRRTYRKSVFVYVCIFFQYTYVY